MNDNDIIGLVQQLNQECFDATFDQAEPIEPFEFRSNGSQAAILFLGAQVWSSENEGSLEFKNGVTALRRNVAHILSSAGRIRLSNLHAIMPPIPREFE